MSKGYVFISNSNKPGMSVPKPMEIDIDNFSHSAIYAADKLGYKIYMGYNVDHPENLKCRQYDVTYFHSNIYRNIFAIRDNYKAYKILCNLLREHPDIEVIHCNTPIGGVIGRLVGRKFKKKVIYTAHGFHFYKGAPLLNWLLFYPIEKFLARWTDVLITINKEDCAVAQRFMGRGKGLAYYVPGVGVNLTAYNRIDTVRQNIRAKLEIEESEVVAISMGDLVPRKNYETSIRALAASQCKNVRYLICGDGPLKDSLEKLAVKYGLSNQVSFLGRRSDIKELLCAADFLLFSTLQEGLSRSLMEAMAMGLPCVASDIRGNNDLIEHGKGGLLYDPNDIKGFAEGIKIMANAKDERTRMGVLNIEMVKNFDLETSKKAFAEIFEKELGECGLTH